MEKIPSHLSKLSKKFYKRVISDYDLENHHLKILLLACECLDRINEAKEVIDKDGIIYYDSRGNPREHPAIKIESNNKVIFARLMRELCLDIEPPKEVGRPPRLYN